jgi:ABC-type proline/glycine betaine transport system ATPase subunit
MMKKQTIKPACKNLLKVYGEYADILLRNSDGKVEPENLSRKGLIAAVQEVDLIITGLSDSGESTFVRLMSRLIYVENFTRHVTPANVLSARAIMTGPSSGKEFRGSAHLTDHVVDIADKIKIPTISNAVHDESSTFVGCVTGRTSWMYS